MTKYYRASYLPGSPGNDDYWKAQLPIVGSIQRNNDNARFWADYKKNTGYSPRYPGRVYSNSGLSGELKSASRSFGRLVMRAYL